MARPLFVRVLEALEAGPLFALDVAKRVCAETDEAPYALGEVLAVLRSLERAALARSKRARFAARPMDRGRRVFRITRRGRNALAFARFHLRQIERKSA